MHNASRAIVHVDGDAFFASCEVARCPMLRGKPVVVGGLRGIAVALTHEAKARGVVRGMPIYQIKKLCPEVVILPGDYDLYERIAERMYEIVRRYTPLVEEYSVDECFADITGSGDITAIAGQIKSTLSLELGVTFSLGLASTKVLAKVASKHGKPNGFVHIRPGDDRRYLEGLPIGKVWGIGRATAQKLYGLGVRTAQELVDQSERWTHEHLHKPHRAIWHELKGTRVYEVETSRGDSKSVASTRTFRPPSADKSFIFSQLSKNVEEACSRARAQGLVARRALWFLKSQEFQYLRFEVPLDAHTSNPSTILSALRPLFDAEFREGIMYRATGITLASIRSEELSQPDLFGASIEAQSAQTVFDVLDVVGHKFGKNSIRLASSIGTTPSVRKVPALNIPFLGDAC